MALNDNICPPDPYILKNAILNYKRAVLSANTDSYLQSFFTIIDELEKQIKCNSSGGAGTSGTNGENGTSGTSGGPGESGSSEIGRAHV